MKRLLILFVLVLSTGCSMEASLESITDAVESFLDPAKTTGLVSGSTQTGTATCASAPCDGVTYTVQSTVGNYMSGIEQTTTDSSYKVYSSVQGAIVSQ